MRLGRRLIWRRNPTFLHVKTSRTDRDSFFRTFAALATASAFLSSAAMLRGDLLEPNGQPVRLSGFEVSAQRVESTNYRVERSVTATKTDTPLLDVPQSISVVSERQINDQQMLSLGDVVRYVPGLTSIQGENNRDQIVFRGNSS